MSISKDRNQEHFKDAINAIDVVDMLDKRRWTWLGHVLRMDKDRNPRRALEIIDQNGTILSYLKPEHRDLNVAAELAANRQLWKDMYSRNDFISCK
jgi:hypothetical protein